MKYGLYSIRDVNVGWNQPFCEVNDAVAKRGFAYSVNNNDLLGFRPQDFDLYKLGTFDPETGIVTDEIPVLVCHGTEVVQKND